MPTLTADDRLAIQELIATYSRHIDLGEWDAVPTLFTDDCSLDFGPMGRYAGRAGVAQFTAILQGMKQLMRHYTTNVTVTGDGETARTHTYLIAMTGPAPGQLSTTTGFYEDELVKRDGRWLFRTRRVLLDLPHG